MTAMPREVAGAKPTVASAVTVDEAYAYSFASAEEVSDLLRVMHREMRARAAHPDFPVPTASKPVHLIPVNSWTPWAVRSGGAALGAVTAAIVTTVLHPHLMGWAAAVAITFTLLFAFVLAGHELRERHPIRFERVP
jgi:hypothetical protein